MMVQLFAILLSAVSAQPAPPQLPPWCPSAGIFAINPDQLIVEDFGTDTFKIAKKQGDDADELEVKGRHWTTSVYPTGPASSWTWDGEAAWKAIHAALDKQGFAVVYLKQDPPALGRRDAAQGPGRRGRLTSSSCSRRTIRTATA